MCHFIIWNNNRTALDKIKQPGEEREVEYLWNVGQRDHTWVRCDEEAARLIATLTPTAAVPAVRALVSVSSGLTHVQDVLPEGLAPAPRVPAGVSA